MRKLLNNPIAVIAIVLVAVVAGAMSLLGDNQPSYTYEEETEDLSMSPLSSPSDGNVTYMTNDEIEASLNLTGLDFSAPDPFYKPINLVQPELPSESPEVQHTETYHLSAIWDQAGSTLILINNRICASGERIGKLLLDTISDEGVWVIRNGDRNFLPMGGTLTFTSKQFKN